MTAEKMHVSIIGASGFTGRELVRILARHEYVIIDKLFSRTYSGKDISDVHPSLKGVISSVLEHPSPEAIPETSKVVFLALPHTKSLEYMPGLLAGDRLVIDLSADYRLKDSQLYEDLYGTSHGDHENLKHAVYGIPEINRNEIKEAKLVANPGCYATAVILSLFPLLKEKMIKGSVFVDAKSGISGAGRKLDQEYLFAERYENLTPYKVDSHRHMGEIIEFLADQTGAGWNRLVFCPHLVPMERGILANLYTGLSGDIKEDDIREIYRKYYGSENFINIYPAGRFPQTKEVDSTNNCNIGIKYNENTGDLVVITAIDNLIKGASGQAVQNMNVALGFPESAGLV